MAIALETIVVPAILRRVWKDIRSRERQVHLSQAPLVRDSTGGAAFELSLKEALEYLRVRVLDRTYRPHPPLIVESAKSRLLHRRLSFLTLEDALLLGALVQSTRPSLIAKMPDWVSFGQADQDRRKTKKQKIITFDYEGWWTKWLSYRKLLKVIEDDPNPVLVTSDIVNFFGSVDLSLLRSNISGVTTLENQANDLLFYLLDRLRPADGYGPRGSFGLPVVADDTSRILAHFYLNELDREQYPEGQKGRYTRWVDDVVVSVPDTIEGGVVVARVERALARIGLVANSSKTALISKDDFRAEHHEKDNEFLDGIHEMTGQAVQLTSLDKLTFGKRITTFLSTRREGHWSRVLRRYYTESRRIRSRTLLRLWDQHLREFPSDARSILDYVSFSPGTLDFCSRLFDFLRSHGPLFEDLQILAYESLLLKPFPDDPILRSRVVHETYRHLLGSGGFDRPGGYVRGLQALTIYKFGGNRAAGLLAKRYATEAVESPVYATYAFPVIAASVRHQHWAFEAVEHIEDSRILRIRALIERLENGDNRATGLIIGLLDPKKTALPTRSVVNPRVLPLLKIALHSREPTTLTRLRNAIDNVAKKVRTTGSQELIDWVTLSHLRY